MTRQALAILLLVFLGVGSSQGPQPSRALSTRREPQLAYFPIVRRQSPVRVVVTQWNDNPYGYTYRTLGYLETTAAVAYEVTLVADVTVYPYSIGTPEPPYTTTVQFEPALEAALPGQPNPFSLEAWCYKRCEVITAVRVARAGPWGGGARVPLAITRWSYQGGALSGTVRNDSARTLVGARVVVAEPSLCAWKEAVLESVTLPPGRQTAFTLDPYSSYCAAGSLLVVGQGQEIVDGTGKGDRTPADQ